MTRQEIEKKAEEYVRNNVVNPDKTSSTEDWMLFNTVYSSFTAGYIEGQRDMEEYTEKDVLELVQQLQELAALKAENETLINESKEWSKQLDAAILKEAQMREVAYKLTKENERLKEDYEGMSKWCRELTELNVYNDNYNEKQIEQLQADKAELLDALKSLPPDTIIPDVNALIKLQAVLKKHEAK